MDDTGPLFCDIGAGLDADRADLPYMPAAQAEEENGQSGSEM